MNDNNMSQYFNGETTLFGAVDITAALVGLSDLVCFLGDYFSSIVEAVDIAAVVPVLGVVLIEEHSSLSVRHC